MARGKRKTGSTVSVEPAVVVDVSSVLGEPDPIEVLEHLLHSQPRQQALLNVALPEAELQSIATTLMLELDRREIRAIEEAAKKALARIPTGGLATVFGWARRELRLVAAAEFARHAAADGAERAVKLTGGLSDFDKRQRALLEQPEVWTNLIASNWTTLTLCRPESFARIFRELLPQKRRNLALRALDLLGSGDSGVGGAGGEEAVRILTLTGGSQ